MARLNGLAEDTNKNIQYATQAKKIKVIAKHLNMPDLENRNCVFDGDLIRIYVAQNEQEQTSLKQTKYQAFLFEDLFVLKSKKRVLNSIASITKFPISHEVVPVIKPFTLPKVEEAVIIPDAVPVKEPSSPIQQGEQSAQQVAEAAVAVPAAVLPEKQQIQNSEEHGEDAAKEVDKPVEKKKSFLSQLSMPSISIPKVSLFGKKKDDAASHQEETPVSASDSTQGAPQNAAENSSEDLNAASGGEAEDDNNAAAPPLEKKKSMLSSLGLPSVHINMPTINMPNFQMPSINVPTINMPKLSMPNIHMPAINLPTLNMPSLNIIGKEEDAPIEMLTWPRLSVTIKDKELFFVFEKMEEHDKWVKAFNQVIEFYEKGNGLQAENSNNGKEYSGINVNLLNVTSFNVPMSSVNVPIANFHVPVVAVPTINMPNIPSISVPSIHVPSVSLQSFNIFAKKQQDDKEVSAEKSDVAGEQHQEATSGSQEQVPQSDQLKVEEKKERRKSLLSSISVPSVNLNIFGRKEKVAEKQEEVAAVAVPNNEEQHVQTAADDEPADKAEEKCTAADEPEKKKSFISLPTINVPSVSLNIFSKKEKKVAGGEESPAPAKSPRSGFSIFSSKK